MASNGFFVFVKMGKALLSCALREIKQLLCVQSLILYYIKQIDSMLPWICPVIDHRGRQNVVRTLVTHSAIPSCATFLFLPHFDVICDLLLDRCTATWNLFVKLSISGYCRPEHRYCQDLLSTSTHAYVYEPLKGSLLQFWFSAFFLPL